MAVVLIPIPQAISTVKEKESLTAITEVVNVEKEMEPAHVPITETMVMESVTEALAPVSKARVTIKR